MTCKACMKRGKTWQGDDPRCAFDERGNFTQDNWNCATINKLRELTRLACGGFDYRDDDSAGTVYVLQIPEIDEAQGYVIMTGYKNRGAIGNALIVFDGSEAKPLTLEAAEAIINAYPEAK